MQTRRIYDSGSDIDGLRSQVSGLEEDLRKASGIRMWHINNLVISFNKAALADSLPFGIAKPDDCTKVFGAIPGFCRDLAGPVVTTWYPTFEPRADGGVNIRNMTGTTLGKSYNFSVILVGV